MVAVPRIFAKPLWTEKEFKKALRQCRDKRLYERLLAIYQSTQGKDAPTIAVLIGRTRQIIYNWIRRWNEEGEAGLHDRPIPGNPGYITKEQKAEVRNVLTSQRPCDVMPDMPNTVVWNVQLMRMFIKHRYGVEYAYGAAWRIARKEFKLNYLLPRQTDYRRPADAELILKKVLVPPSSR